MEARSENAEKLAPSGQVAPVGQNYFKQSLTRLLFIADKVLFFSLEMLLGLFRVYIGVGIGFSSLTALKCGRQ